MVVVLVVMESGLKDVYRCWCAYLPFVVVLVVMESGLKDLKMKNMVEFKNSRSPCCNGEWFKSST